MNNSLGGVLYVICWSLLASIFLPAAKPLRIALAVLIITCIIEFMQLWHPPFLESIRSTRMGATLLGNSFTWLDFPHYLLGSVIAYLLLYLISKSKG